MSGKTILLLSAASALILTARPVLTAADAKPLKVLLIAGGCCHDYANQKGILKKGIEARANAEVDIIFVADGSTQPKLPIYGNPDYAKGYDLVIHDECAADVNDSAVVEGVLKPHRDGIPGVNLHCGMHSYRIGNPNDPVTLGTPHGFWFEYLGLQSSGHGAQLPIAIRFTDSNNSITKGLTDWTTINEELYNNIKVFDGAQSLARGKQGKSEVVVAWTNLYQGKTRVFSTTIGHNNQTVEDPRYLDLVTRGVSGPAASSARMENRCLATASKSEPDATIEEWQQPASGKIPRVHRSMNSMISPCAFAFLSVGLTLPAIAVENWPQFRGPNGRGISAVAAPTTWNVETGENVRWTTDLPGLGHAGPIIWADRVYIATAVRPGTNALVKIGLYGDGDSYKEKEPHQWRLLCLDKATGRLLWDKLGNEAVPRQERHTKATHCNSTPATDGHRIVTIFGSEGLFCFDMDGSLLWKKDLGKMDAGPWNSPGLQWSFASSPLLHDGKVIVQCDVLSEQFLAVFDAKDGREIWRTVRKEVANWCTPAVAELKGRTQIVLNGWKQLGGYDFESGKQIWELSGGGDIPVPAPLVVDDFAFFTSAHGKYRPLRAVRLSAANGDIAPPNLESTNAAIAWCHPRLGSYMQTPIVVGDKLWSCDLLGILSCVDTTTGEIHYSERLGKGGQAFTASGVAAGNHLYFASEAGDVFVVEANSKFSVLATNLLGGLCLATPAASDGTLFFRTTEKLMAVRPK